MQWHPLVAVTATATASIAQLVQALCGLADVNIEFPVGEIPWALSPVGKVIHAKILTDAVP